MSRPTALQAQIKRIESGRHEMAQVLYELADDMVEASRKIQHVCQITNGSGELYTAWRGVGQAAHILHSVAIEITTGRVPILIERKDETAEQLPLFKPQDTEQLAMLAEGRHHGGLIREPVITAEPTVTFNGMPVDMGKNAWLRANNPPPQIDLFTSPVTTDEPPPANGPAADATFFGAMQQTKTEAGINATILLETRPDPADDPQPFPH